MVDEFDAWFYKKTYGLFVSTITFLAVVQDVQLNFDKKLYESLGGRKQLTSRLFYVFLLLCKRSRKPS